jgi:hypothetical protein
MAKPDASRTESMRNTIHRYQDQAARAAPAAVLLLATLLSGCGIIYTDVRTPHAYRTATPSEVHTTPQDPTVEGRACNQSVLFLFAWGDGGYLAATQDALKDHPDGILYDVKTDTRATGAALGAWVRVCTVVRAKVGRT